MALFLVLSMFTGIFALLDAEMTKQVAAFAVNQLVFALLSIVPLLVFVRLVHVVIVSKEFFSRRQSRRMLTIAICFAMRVVLDLLAPSIKVPALPNGAVGPMSIGPSLNLTMLAVSIMFFALAGVFEYGRKLQEDSDNIL
ncbi:MAG: DUF2975 domain-containing protein [Collinsella sp.]|nr:DUF2975 domain-containing protein [Collinsella sp.]